MKAVERVGSPAEGPLVLYVEDERSNWEVTELQLRRKFRLLWARTDAEACALVREHGATLHAVLMDVQLMGSRLDGVALTRALRGKAQGELPDFAQGLPTLDCPIFFVTAFGTRYSTDELREAGGDSYVPKPVDFLKLSMVLGQADLRRALVKFR